MLRKRHIRLQTVFKLLWFNRTQYVLNGWLLNIFQWLFKSVEMWKWFVADKHIFNPKGGVRVLHIYSQVSIENYFQAVQGNCGSRFCGLIVQELAK